MEGCERVGREGKGKGGIGRGRESKRDRRSGRGKEGRQRQWLPGVCC